MKNILLLVAKVVVAVILLQTLFFKFTGSEESIDIFETVGMESWGRYASGFGELIAAVLLFVPQKAWLGATIGIGIILGAIFFHLTKLGIEVHGDGGLLFYLAMTVLICCSYILYRDRHNILFLKNNLQV